jgi:hypothetical protein
MSMTRQNRLIVILVAIGVLGTGVLVALAHHLRSRLPGPAAHGSVATSPVGSAVATGREAGAVDAYLAGRRASGKVLTENPKNAKQLEAVTSGHYDIAKGQRMASDVDFAIKYKIARYDALTAAGSSEAEYEAVRTAYRSWKSGGTCAPAFAGAFESKRADLAAVELGNLEGFDDQVK